METIGKMAIYEIIILVAIGLLMLFLGYRVKKIAFFVIWFFLGFSLINMLLPNINELIPQIKDNPLWQNLLPVGGGLLLALLGFSIEKLCLGGICFALVMVITVRYFGTGIQTLAIGAIVGVVAAGAAVMLMKPAAIIATSAAGAYALTLVILSSFAEINQETFYFPILGGLTLLGSVVQFLTTKRID